MIRELRHIHGFLAVARCGSFTRAAAELRVSQPALTVQVRQLESQLGVSLFDRNKRRVALTQAGPDLVAYPLILLVKESSVRDIFDHALEKEGLKISVAHESIYMSTALGMASAGLGVAVLPESALEVASHPQLRIVPVSSPALTRKIG